MARYSLVNGSRTFNDFCNIVVDIAGWCKWQDAKFTMTVLVYRVRVAAAQNRCEQPKDSRRDPSFYLSQVSHLQW